MPQPTVTDARSARVELGERLTKLSMIATNVGTFATMAEDARNRGDHTLAKKHLKKALDYEFEMFAETPTISALLEVWYPGQQL